MDRDLLPALSVGQLQLFRCQVWAAIISPQHSTQFLSDFWSQVSVASAVKPHQVYHLSDFPQGMCAGDCLGNIQQAKQVLSAATEIESEFTLD